MKIFTAEKIREADAYTIRHEPISSIDLMERAAGRLVRWILSNYEKDTPFSIFAGPGNNGGDGWAVARLLWKSGYVNIRFFLVQISEKLSADSEKNRKRLDKETEISVRTITSEKQFPAIQPGEVVIDALFGSGLSRPPEGLAADIIQYLNEQAGEIIAVDIPSGLFAEDNTDHDSRAIIRADHTLSFQFPKLAFFFAENADFVGNWYVLPIQLHPRYIEETETPFHQITPEIAGSLLLSRKKFSHKGTYGHGLLIAGSYGMMGATVLSASAGIRSGAGLITCHVPRMGVDTLQAALPEVLVSIDESDIIFTEHPPLDKYSAVAVGPGLNQKSNTRKALFSLLRDVRVPLVIDADGLNLLAGIENWQDQLPPDTILTPHPKEFERLFGSFPDSYSRLQAQIDFSIAKSCTIVLKGAHTCITFPNGKVWFNITGNPGMATGGSGDVLTGILLGLLTQGYTVEQASILAVYLHGLAGDLALTDSHPNAVIASDITHNIGRALRVIEKTKTRP